MHPNRAAEKPAWRKAWENPRFRFGVGLLVSALLLYLAFRDVSLAEVLIPLRQANLLYVGLALLSVILNNLFKVVRWQVMLGPPGRQVRFGDLLMAHLSGQTLNALLPFRAGDISRVVVIGNKGPGWAFVLGSVALEKLVDLLSYALLFVLVFLLIPLPDWMGDSGWLLLGATSLLAVVTYFIALKRRQVIRLVERWSQHLPGAWGAYLLERLQNGLESLEVLQRRSDLALIALWTAVTWGLALLTNQLTLLALDIHLKRSVEWSASLLLLVALIAGISVVTVPGRLGIFEWICVLVLSLYGVGQAEALSYGFLLHALVYLPVIIGGIISLLILAREGVTVRSYGNR